MPNGAEAVYLHSLISLLRKQKAWSSWRMRSGKYWRDEMERLVSIIKEMGIPYAYDHFAAGEAPDPPFLS